MVISKHREPDFLVSRQTRRYETSDSRRGQRYQTYDSFGRDPPRPFAFQSRSRSIRRQAWAVASLPQFGPYAWRVKKTAGILTVDPGHVARGGQATGVFSQR